eukprot:3241135-Pleurochrysis_carterae.AAC.2
MHSFRFFGRRGSYATCAVTQADQSSNKMSVGSSEKTQASVARCSSRSHGRRRAAGAVRAFVRVRVHAYVHAHVAE